jgi:hypothetical protein
VGGDRVDRQQAEMHWLPTASLVLFALRDLAFWKSPTLSGQS